MAKIQSVDSDRIVTPPTNQSLFRIDSWLVPTKLIHDYTRWIVAFAIVFLLATILHLLGLDHRRLTCPYNGRNFRITDVSGEVLHKIIA
jgi:hypothetical protein